MTKITDFLRINRIIVFGLADLILIIAAITLAFLVRFEGAIPQEYVGRLPVYFVILAILNLFFIWRLRLYSFTWEFVSLSEFSRIVKAVTYANALFAILVLVGWGEFKLFSGFPRSILFINYVFDLLFIGALRISKRFFKETINFRTTSQGEKTLIVGAGEEGERLIRNLLKSPSYELVGIVDNNRARKNAAIHGVRVLGTIKDIPKIVKGHDIRQIIIALTSAQAGTIREAVNLGRGAGIKNIKIIPDTHELLSGKLKLTDIREIQVEDLLGRKPTKIDTKKISEFIKDKVVLITGAAGSIGSELVRQCLAFEPTELILLDFNESGLFDLEADLLMQSPKNRSRVKAVVASITDKDKLERIIAGYQPDVIFHAAAYKHVPLMEDFPDEAVKTNVFGTLNLAETAIRHEIPKFVLVSTDKAIRPVSVMGKTKRVAELITQSLNQEGKTRFVAVRFGNVIGSRGSVLPLFQEQIKRRAPLTVTHPEMTRYFMTIPEAAILVLEAGAVGNGGEIFMLDMGEPVKILEVAKETIRLAGLRPDVDVPIVFTGVRPGEKIFEEIFSEDEKRVGATQWDKIFITKTENATDPTAVKEKVELLGENLRQSNDNLKTALDECLQYHKTKLV